MTECVIYMHDIVSQAVYLNKLCQVIHEVLSTGLWIMKTERLQIQGTLCPTFGKQAVTADKWIKNMGDGERESGLAIDLVASCMMNWKKRLDINNESSARSVYWGFITLLCEWCALFMARSIWMDCSLGRVSFHWETSSQQGTSSSPTLTASLGLEFDIKHVM